MPRSDRLALVMVPILLAGCIGQAVSPAFLDPASAAPASTVAPASPPRTDSPTYRGGLDRSGVMPGPGPAGPVARRWEFKADSPIGTSPAVVDGVVYVADDGGTVSALALKTGTVIWHRHLDDPPLSSPTVVDDLVLIGANGHVHALDVGSGADRWVAPADGVVAGAPAADGGTIIFATNVGSVVSVDAAEGRQLWSTSVGAAITRTLAVAGGSVFAGAQGGLIVALKESDGTVQWRTPTGAAGGVGTIVAVGGSVFVCTGLDNADRSVHHLIALDAATGTEAWRYSNAAGVPVYPPVAIGGRLYVVGEDSHVVALDARSAAVLWTFTMRGSIEAAAAWAAGVLYVADDAGRLYAIDAATGSELWDVGIRGVPSAPVVDGGVVLVPTNLGLVDAWAGGG